MMALLSGDGAINNRTDALKAPGQTCGTHHSRQESSGGGLDKGFFFCMTPTISLYEIT